jgi:hypothetical protein
MFIHGSLANAVAIPRQAAIVIAILPTPPQPTRTICHRCHNEKGEHDLLCHTGSLQRICGWCATAGTSI